MHHHEVAIQAIVDLHPGAKTVGFSKAVAAIMDERFPETIIPDAWLMDVEAKVLTAFEVEDSHPVPAYKMLRYARLWWWLDDCDWTLVLKVCGRWGDDLRPIDLLAYDMRAKRLMAQRKREAQQP